MATVAKSTTLGNSEEMEGGQDGHTTNITTTQVSNPFPLTRG